MNLNCKEDLRVQESFSVQLADIFQRLVNTELTGMEIMRKINSFNPPKEQEPQINNLEELIGSISNLAQSLQSLMQDISYRI